MLLAVVLYFALAALALALLLLPQARAHALVWAQRLASGGAQAGRHVTATSQRGAGRAAQGLGGLLRDGLAWIVGRRTRIAIAIALMLAGPLLAFALRGFASLDGYDHRVSREANEQVAALLQGEQLVAPPLLPPGMFMTPEVEQAIPMARGASRQWELLGAEFRQRMLVVFKLMREQHGVEMVLLEGYRSPERQAQLAALGPQVTHAGAFASYHQYGLAADCAFLRDGRVVLSERDPWVAAAYAHYGEVARSAGLTWGGGWRSLKDYGHVELPNEGVLHAAPRPR